MLDCVCPIAGGAIVAIVALMLGYGWLHALERRISRIEHIMDEDKLP
jgi:hypothetical protein